MALATYTDLETRLGVTLSSAEQDRADALLEQSSELVMTYAGDVEEADAPIQAVIVAVECVVRVWVNPNSVSSESLGSTSASFGATGGLFLTDDEKAALGQAFGNRGGAYSIQLS